ncbi:hypothetical protein ACTGJ9_039140 [Bradyrhizobium sp. RDM12]
MLKAEQFKELEAYTAHCAFHDASDHRRTELASGAIGNHASAINVARFMVALEEAILWLALECNMDATVFLVLK